MKSILIHIFALYGLLCFIGLISMIVIFGPRTYRYFRDKDKIDRSPNPNPFDWPVWMYRLRRWARIEWQQMKNRRDQIGGILFVFVVLGLLALGLIVSCPS